jgi:hypothetical protein
MMKKLVSVCVVAFALVTAAAGCRSSAGVRTANHAVGVGAGAH